MYKQPWAENGLVGMEIMLGMLGQGLGNMRHRVLGLCCMVWVSYNLPEGKRCCLILLAFGCAVRGFYGSFLMIHHFILAVS